MPKTRRELLATVKAGDRVTVLVPNGLSLVNGKVQQDWKSKTGRAVILGPAGWVLNMGGRYGTPGVATADNVLTVRRGRS